MYNTILGLAMVRDLRNLANSLEAFLGQSEPAEESEKSDSPVGEPQKSEPVTLERVREIVMQKSRSGKQAEVRALIKKHGAEKITDLDPGCYEKLLKEVGGIQ